MMNYKLLKEWGLGEDTFPHILLTCQKFKNVIPMFCRVKRKIVVLTPLYLLLKLPDLMETSWL